MIRPTIALTTIALVAPTLVAQNLHEFDIDQTTSTVTYSGTVTAGPLMTTLTGQPPTVNVGGSINAQVDGTSSITSASFSFDEENAIELPNLVAVIDNPVVGQPPIGMMVGQNIRIQFRSSTGSGLPATFAVAPDGSFNTFVVSCALSGTIAISGPVNTNVDITGFISTPQAVSGNLSLGTDGLDLTMTYATTLGLTLPGLGATVTVNGMLDSDDAGFAANVSGFPATTGGAQTMTVSAGSAAAGETYIVLASAAGTAPGVPLPGGFTLPLNIDALLDQSFFGANMFPWGNTLGTLDALGRADATFSLPPLPGVLAGLQIHHAPLVLDAGANVLAAGPAASITLQ